MKTINLLLLIFLLNSCVTINMVPQKVDDAQINVPGKGLKMKSPNETVTFTDSTDGFTYKWVKVKVLPNGINANLPGRNDSGQAAFIAPVAHNPATDMREKPKTGTFKDDRDGHVYKTVTIGNQTWMAQNLDFQTAGAMYYDNDPKNGDTYGMLYTYTSIFAACPKGWHIPSDAEWQQLEYNVGMSKDDVAKGGFRGSVAANLLDGGAGKMNIKFSGRYGLGKFSGLGETTELWSSTRQDNPITTRLFKIGDNRICSNRLGPAYVLSIRCIKD